MSGSTPTIYIQNASLHYKNLLLFDHLNFTLPAGKWICLLGPSGVGKTSLLRLLAGINTGSHVNAQITTSDHLPLTGRIAYMAQEDLLMPWCSVLNNVLLGSHLRHEKETTKNREYALHLLEKVGLKKYAYAKPNALSGGMRQRVALARTLMEQHPIVLMDEPFASLDIITRLRLQELAAELLINRTVLLVTHDPLEALRLADEIYVMRGLPAQLGTAIKPQGGKPRAVNDPQLLELQAELLQQLMQAQI
jgi:putative hydroxymethylpyrimidine transport system ATP-binding protein